jgi:hypothetical protein
MIALGCAINDERHESAGFYGGTGICSAIRYGAIFFRHGGVEDQKRGTKHAWEPWGMRLLRTAWASQRPIAQGR